MNTEQIKADLHCELYERRPGKFQLIHPTTYPDGDMVDVYLTDNPHGDEWIRICDFGMALMRRSFTADLDGAEESQQVNSLLRGWGIGNNNGNLYLDSAPADLSENIDRFIAAALEINRLPNRTWVDRQ